MFSVSQRKIDKTRKLATSRHYLHQINNGNIKTICDIIKNLQITKSKFSM